MRALAATLALALAALGCRAPPQATLRPILARGRSVRCALVWDPSVGVITDGRVVFDDERISAFGPAAAVPQTVEEIDLRPLFCLPGLVDAHTHLTSYAHGQSTDSLETRRDAAERNAAQTVQAGITSTRDLGAEEGVDLWLRSRVASGASPGPRMQCAGSQIGVQGPVGGAASAKAQVDAHLGAGFDVIKLFATGGASDPLPLLTAPEIAAATTEAHVRGARVAVHAITAEGIQRSIDAGVDSVEHGTELSVEQARTMAARGIVLVPTLYILRYYVEDADNLGFSAEDVADLRRVIDDEVLPFEKRFPTILATGLKVAMGSDAFLALHGKNARELAYLVRAGMRPEQALRAATENSAALLGWSGKAGSLAPGAYADLIAVAGNPLEDMGAIEHVVVVLKGGKIVRDERR